MSLQPTDQPGLAWKVTSNQPAQGRLPNGSYGPGHQITVQLPSGSSGQVFVPNELYSNIELVRSILAEKAASIDAVDNLTGMG